MNSPLFSAQILPDRAIIRVAGDGALAFLHNVLTADLLASEPSYGALLSPQGKILHDIFIVPDFDAVWLDVATPQAPDLLKRLMMYRLRAKLEIVLDAGKAVAVSANMDLPGLRYGDPRLAALGQRAIVGVGTLALGKGYKAHRLSLGIADSVDDIGCGELFVHEANLDQLNGVSFSKGCYVGQEVVSRTHHRGTARNRILPVHFAGSVQHGTEITAGDTRLGSMLSSDQGVGLALLRLDRLADVTHPLMAGGGRLSVERPTWADFEMIIPEVAQ